MLTFWYDFSSSYSYLAAQTIEPMAEAAGVSLAWRPFLLGPIFKDAGYGGSPNLVSPAKADYMWSDIARRAAHLGLPFVRPHPFPQNSVKAGRAALAVEPALRPALTRALFDQVFRDGADISDVGVIGSAAKEAGLEQEAVIEGATSQDAKDALFATVDEARSLGIFGAPTFVCGDGALFWGSERIKDALAWETTGALPKRG